ncbi:NuoI/complex I 23 kDa subunit family protein [Pajaroellobacter abortibovis]|uniref:NADH-quinone oxidoreductase subunit I n=1 Tax=Pajaroellobacter abortibovis TaxID=1882918 RepID=A0A1L6MX89_9BACT|nr:NADH-quinone oxidoreductase subunit I [Pajaroellobacter abortibovis]APS00137.1 NADH dehydrogenase [Pajaroellobacter abortibovis]
MNVTFPKKSSPDPKVKVVSSPAKTLEIRAYLPEVIKGIGVSMKHFFHNIKDMVRAQRPDPVKEGLEDGIVTISYPEQKRPYPERFRGVHRLTTREDGSVRCVACLCCSTACPAQCIFIEAGEYLEGDPRRGYERYPVRFVIDELRCIFCGYCVEACPCDAIRMDTGIHPAPYDSRDQFIYSKDLLLSFTNTRGETKTQNPRHEPGDPTYPGIDREQTDHE